MSHIRVTCRSVSLFTALAALLLMRSGSVSAAQAGWQLVDYHQQTCVRLGNPYNPSPTTYYAIWINGTWTQPINASVTQLPAHSSFSTNYLPLAPGSSTGVYSLASVSVTVSPDTPIGIHTLAISATDGTSMQSIPVTLRVTTTKCRAY
jgi:hypothetical protein